MAESESETRVDGFSVRMFEGDAEVRFIPSTLNGTQRERSLMRLLRNMDTDLFYVADTRDQPAPPTQKA